MDYPPSHHYDDAVLIAPKTEGAYFERYRLAHPSERFDVLDFAALEEMFQFDLGPGIDEALLSLGTKRDGLELTKTILRRLRFAPRIDALTPYFALKDELEKKGLLRVIHDPFAYFKGRMIIVRGYPDGRGISEVMQDLPNICVNFDFGQERPREIPAEEIALDELEPLSENAESPVYLVAAEGQVPDALSDLPRLDSPYVPSQGSFIVLIGEKPLFEAKALPLDEVLLKALRLPTASEAKRRLDVEVGRLLSSPRLLAIVRANA